MNKQEKYIAGCYLHYFNQILRDKGLISDSEYRKMGQKIKSEKRSDGKS